MEGAVLVAKMQVQSVTERFDGKGATAAKDIELTPVTGKGNEPWSKWTPSGVLKLNVTNPEAFGAMKAGTFKVYVVPCGAED